MKERPMRTIKNFSLILATLGFILTPALGLAREDKPTAPASDAKNFCTRIANVTGEVNSKLVKDDQDRGSKRTEVFNQLKERKESRVKQVQEKRDQAKADLDERLSDLESDALTEAQLSALAAFRAAVAAAQEVRKAAVDKAMADFRTSQESLVTKRQDAIKANATTFKADVAAAMAKAKTDCAASVDPATVRRTLMSAQQAAKDKFQQANKDLDKLGGQIKNLTQTRNQAVRDANQAFKAALETARQNLKAAFAQS